VADLVRKAERKREIKEEIETWKLEQSAERMWSQALALLADEQKRKAERLFRRLLRKKYAATPAGLRAAERFPEWAAEERASGK
jgi:23S rRNA maturation-related 3'-5' exoribonuclease YhaM